MALLSTASRGSSNVSLLCKTDVFRRRRRRHGRIRPTPTRGAASSARPHPPLPSAHFSLRAGRRVGPLPFPRRNWTARPTARDAALFRASAAATGREPLPLLLRSNFLPRASEETRQRAPEQQHDVDHIDHTIDAVLEGPHEDNGSGEPERGEGVAAGAVSGGEAAPQEQGGKEKKAKKEKGKKEAEGEDEDEVLTRSHIDLIVNAYLEGPHDEAAATVAGGEGVATGAVSGGSDAAAAPSDEEVDELWREVADLWAGKGFPRVRAAGPGSEDGTEDSTEDGTGSTSESEDGTGDGSGFKGLRQAEDGSEDAGEGGNATETSLDVFQTWDELRGRERDALRAIGYDEDIWNGQGRVDTQDTAFEDLDDDEQEGAKAAGYTEELWDAMVAAGDSPRIVGKDQNTSSVSSDEEEGWDDMRGRERNAWKALGYTRESWNNDDDVDTQWMYWGELSPEQREAALELNFTAESWDLMVATMPTRAPTSSPTRAPTRAPTRSPTGSPSGSPSGGPSASPTGTPSASPSDRPSTSPSASPTGTPSSGPTDVPSASPSHSPTISRVPTEVPTVRPSGSPTDSPSGSPSGGPSAGPSARPTTSTRAPVTGAPTVAPTDAPSRAPQGVVSAAVGRGRAAGAAAGAVALWLLC